ncbi:MAG: HNH endonuclease [Candidatus Symbiopectobacterium sp. Dall1.0]|nr:HNH endonuclease [Candidatus Symbiopectobacterium sp. Dall1.0]
MRKDFKERLMDACTEEPGGCWVWNLSVSSGGYGQIRRNGINCRANRASYEAFNGEIPDGGVVRHTCDNKLCIKPSHLVIGTNQDNSSDMVERNRQASGSRNGRCKLSANEVMEIRSSSLSYSKLAKKYGISKGHAHRIKNGVAWSLTK